MAATTNYGSTFTFNSVVLGKCFVQGFPKFTTSAIDTTNHASGGFGESIPDGLIRVGEFSIEMLNESGLFSALRTLMVNKTIAAAILTNGVDTITGSAFITDVELREADAQMPDANAITFLVNPTGSWT